MKLGIFQIVIGIIFVAIAIGIFYTIERAKDDAELVIYIFMMLFTGFGGLSLVASGINECNSKE